MTYVDTEGMRRAAEYMNAAAENMNRAAHNMLHVVDNFERIASHAIAHLADTLSDDRQARS